MHPMCLFTRVLRNVSTASARAATLLAATAFGAAACSNIDCPLDNKVEVNCRFYDTATGGGVQITDTITITAAGTDSVLFNYGYDISELFLPLSYTRTVDTFVVNIMGRYASAADTIFVAHTNEPHFQSVDCGMLMFHTIKDVAWTTHGGSATLSRIDSVAVAHSNVNYDEAENLKIYFAVP